jgi:glutathione peroxidase
MNAWDFSLSGLEGGVLDLAAWRGKPVLIVNTASECGFTPQYRGLEELWQHFEGELIVLGVPCNQFGKQEPGTSAQIGAFCRRNYGVSFPMAARTDVKGAEAAPLFRWLAHEGGVFSRPRWNFYKYLIGRDGHLITWFSSLTSPASPRLQKAVNNAVKS